MEIFTGKITCLHCGKSFKRKKERYKYKWVCQGYDNFASCQRIVIDEERMIEFIGRRLLIQDRTDESIIRFISDRVVKIVVKNKYNFDIQIVNEETMYQHEGHFQY